MIPGWKLRRELGRLFEQIASLPAFFYEPIQQARYDAWRKGQQSLRDGGAPATSKICIFLVYQPARLPDSVINTCIWLQERGYATLLVANGGLPDGSAASVESLVWKILERPNFGYDFGGYRDGMLQLEALDLRPERVVILNDSIWLPMHPRPCPLTLAEAVPDAITGLLVHTRLGIHQPDNKGMIESYFYSIPSAVLNRVEFWQFWKGLRLSNVKARVIHRGERGFSKAMHAARVPLGALSSRRVFLMLITQQDTDFLRLALQHAAYVDPPLADEGAKLLATFQDAQEWRTMALQHIERTVSRRRFNASFYMATDQLGLTNFMKKNRGALFVQMRKAALSAFVMSTLHPPDAVTLAEIRALDG